jgi:hypothetical protein
MLPTDCPSDGRHQPRGLATRHTAREETPALFSAVPSSRPHRQSRLDVRTLRTLRTLRTGFCGPRQCRPTIVRTLSVVGAGPTVRSQRGQELSCRRLRDRRGPRLALCCFSEWIPAGPTFCLLVRSATGRPWANLMTDTANCRFRSKAVTGRCDCVPYRAVR